MLGVFDGGGGSRGAFTLSSRPPPTFLENGFPKFYLRLSLLGFCLTLLTVFVTKPFPTRKQTPKDKVFDV